MSITSIQSNIRRSKTKITELRKKLSKEQESEAKTRKDILQTKKSISRTSSQPIIRNRLSKLERLSKTIQSSAKQQSELNKKIVEEEKKLHRYEEQLLIEETRELKRQATLRIHMEKEHEMNQQSLLTELEEFKASVAEHTKELSNKNDTQEQFDVFISHASDDKDAFVRPLAEFLIGDGIKVWYDERNLTWGKPTRRTIDQGLTNSRFGIVVLSEAFFRKAWTNYELDGLLSRHLSESNLILPIWHDVDYIDVQKYSPSLADLTALKSSDMSIQQIADQLIQLLEESK